MVKCNSYHLKKRRKKRRNVLGYEHFYRIIPKQNQVRSITETNEKGNKLE